MKGLLNTVALTMIRATTECTDRDYPSYAPNDNVMIVIHPTEYKTHVVERLNWVDDHWVFELLDCEEAHHLGATEEINWDIFVRRLSTDTSLYDLD